MINLVLFVLLIASMVAGVSAYGMYLKNIRRQRENEIKAANDRAMLECLRHANEQQTNRLAIMARLIQRNQNL